MQQLFTHASQLHRSGSFSAAADTYRQLLRTSPNNPEFIGRLGNCLLNMGRVDEGRRQMEKALKLAPNSPMLVHDLHLTYKREGNWAKAEELIDKALRMSPLNPTFTASKSELLVFTGDPERALRVLEPVRGQAGEIPAVALVFASLSPRIGAERECAAAIRKLLSNAELAPTTRIKLGFALGFVLDVAGEHDEAWRAIETARTGVSSSWDPQRNRASVDAAIAGWSTQATRSAARGAVDASSAILIVGMPRTGRGLVASMLAALPESAAAGEQNDLILAARDLEGGVASGMPYFTRPSSLTESALTERGSAYLDRLRAVRPGAKLVSDRLPMNMCNLGLISRMLPGVRIVHCTRDPLDIGVATFMHLTTAALPFQHRLEHIGAFIRDANRLMSHWKSTIDAPILDVAYEELLARPEASARRLAEFVGRPWTEAMLAPARSWVSTVTLPDGSMRDLVPDGRAGIATDYDRHLATLREALR